MSTNVLINDRTISSVLAWPQLISWPVISEAKNSLALEVDIPRFQFHNSFAIVEFLPADSKSGVARVFIEIDAGVRAILTLTGHLVDGSDIFQVERLGVKMETTVSRAR